MQRLFFDYGYKVLGLLCIIIDLSDIEPDILLNFYRRVRICLKRTYRRLTTAKKRLLTRLAKLRTITQKPLRYHIEVPSDYWDKVYGSIWRNATNKEKEAIRDEFLSDLMQRLIDGRNRDVGILSERWINWAGKEVGISINVIGSQRKYHTDPTTQPGRKQVPFRPTTLPQQSYQSDDHKRYFWTVLTILTTMLTILMAQLLFGCTKPKTESSTPAALPVDTTRQRLQRQVQTADSAVILAKDSTLKTQKPYEDAVLDYTLRRDRLGF